MSERVPSALDHFDAIVERIPASGPALFLDYDGTLSALQPRPEMAVLDAGMRAVLERLAGKCFLAVISGRDRAVVKDLVGMPDIHYAGSHGFDISGPDGFAWEQADGARARPGLAAASQQVERAIDHIEAAWVERKRYATSIHFRQVDKAHHAEIEAIVRGTARRHPGLRVSEGKCVLELRPDVDWHKGRAVEWLMETLTLGDALPMYIGDDVTDEDGLRAMLGRGVGIRVGNAEVETAASYRLDGVPAVQRFLERLLETLG